MFHSPFSSTGVCSWLSSRRESPDGSLLLSPLFSFIGARILCPPLKPLIPFLSYRVIKATHITKSMELNWIDALLASPLSAGALTGGARHKRKGKKKPKKRVVCKVSSNKKRRACKAVRGGKTDKRCVRSKSKKGKRVCRLKKEGVRKSDHPAIRHPSLKRSQLVKRKGVFRSKKKSEGAKRKSSALSRWRDAAKAEGYLKKGSFKRLPKKGTAAHKRIQERYRKR